MIPELTFIVYLEYVPTVVTCCVPVKSRERVESIL